MPRIKIEEQIEGRRPVLEALTGERVVKRVLIARTAQGGVVTEIQRLARDRGVEVQEVDPRWLDQVSRTGTHQGVIALAGPRPTADVDDLLERSRRAGEPPFLVLLDGIQDPQNTGAIIRVADAAGVHGVILPQRRASGLTPAVARASAGAVEHLPVAQVTNLSRTMEDLKKAGIWVVGADLSGEDIFRADIELPLAVVIGSEGQGLSRLVKERCDRLVRIPMYGRVASLNAATAAAVILFEIRRRRPR